MSIRIGSNVSSLYNATRLNPAQDIDRASRVEQKQDISLDQQSARSGSRYIAQDHGGVVQTRVSDANAFQKSQLDGSRERIEDMADKLFSKLPDIFSDMQKLPDAAAEDQAAANRVAVTERNAAAVADRQAQAAQSGELQNFTV